ncbi:hypothetical protein DXG01_005831 [Tephrocybe rancida]|nr:hypothetical protein DXG01_005831 [Tephrocybe rancida]
MSTIATHSAADPLDVPSAPIPGPSLHRSSTSSHSKSPSIPLSVPPRSYPDARGASQYHSRLSTRTESYPSPPYAAHRSRANQDEDIGSSDSSSDYTSDEDELDQLEDEDEKSPPSFGFSAAKWTSKTKPHQGDAYTYTHPRHERERTRVHQNEKVYHPSRYDIHSQPFTSHENRVQSSSSITIHYPPRRPYLSPEPSYTENRDFETRNTREVERESHRDDRVREGRVRLREEGKHMSTRSSQTSPVRIEPVHPAGPRTFLRVLTPSAHRGRSTSPAPLHHKQEYEWRDHDRERFQNTKRKREWEIDEREHERQRLKQRAKHGHHRAPPRPPSPTPSTSASDTQHASLAKKRIVPSSSSTQHRKPAPQAQAQPRMVLPGPNARIPLPAPKPPKPKPPTTISLTSKPKPQKPRHPCPHCPQSFSRKNDAYRHIARKHGEGEVFACACGRELSRGDALRRHWRSCKFGKGMEAKVEGGMMGDMMGDNEVGDDEGDEVSMEEED